MRKIPQLIMDATFTALDFETAQGYRWSICQVGLVRVEQGKITHELCQLVRPPENYYWERFTEIHGLGSRETARAPRFDQLWPKLAPFIEQETVVAHNAAFDGSCLSQALNYYGLAVPEYTQRCTYRLYGQGLAPLCQTYGIPLHHHDALSDARACAELYLQWLQP